MDFNGLTAAEAERLTWLAEELSEALKEVCKIQRHGYENYDPRGPSSWTNRLALQKELGDCAAAIDMMVRARDIDFEFIRRYQINKSAEVQQFMHHQE